jgi:GINS complex subunit 3
VLVDSIGRVGDDDKTERLLSREERRIWDAGRMAQAEYERWRYGRSGRVVATKAVLDNKRQKRG